MRSPRVLGVIPARLGSERLPRKPLHPLAGRPLIEWVWRSVSGFDGMARVVVATDAEEVVAACRSFGAEATLTAKTHGSGTERVAEVATRRQFGEFDIVVNIQGDEPFVTEEQVMGAVTRVREGWPIGTVAAPIRDLEAWRDPGVVKVTRRVDGAALFFSRACIPHRRDADPTPSQLSSDLFLRHIGIYAYTPEALQRWVALPPSPLEETERLEQLRPLAHGMGIGVELVAEAGEGIDTPEDARRAEGRLRREWSTQLEREVER